MAAPGGAIDCLPSEHLINMLSREVKRVRFSLMDRFFYLDAYGFSLDREMTVKGVNDGSGET